jgi:hypothetical protein
MSDMHLYHYKSVEEDKPSCLVEAHCVMYGYNVSKMCAA